ncbi:MAG: hypothetical protein JWO57_1396 [Pseudonocardiales bacterium]|nr:hypothetical protein [Pseudonocardiales bacterium]
MFAGGMGVGTGVVVWGSRSLERGHPRRPGLDSESLRRVATRVLPSPRATPLASGLVIGLLVSAVLLDTNPADITAVVAWASTNVHNLAHHPVAAMIASAFVVPGLSGAQIAIIAVAGAALERRIGTARTVLVALSGQVLATLLTEYGADLGAQLHLWTASSADRADVGVSYVMFSVLAAACLLLEGTARVLAIAAISTWVSIMFLMSPGMTSTGHLLSVAFGLATMWLLRRHSHSAAQNGYARGDDRVAFHRPRRRRRGGMLLRSYGRKSAS